MTSAPPRDEDCMPSHTRAAAPRDEEINQVGRAKGMLGNKLSSKFTLSATGGNARNDSDKAIGETFWDKMDKHFEDILSESKLAFKIKTIINITVVIVGIVLVGNAIVYSWIKGTDGWSLFSGGMGLGALVSLFFYKSQDAISKAVANVSVVDMVFKSHYRAYESITDYDYKADHGLEHREIADLKVMLELLENTTRAHVGIIEQMQLIVVHQSQDNDVRKESSDKTADTRENIHNSTQDPNGSEGQPIDKKER